MGVASAETVAATMDRGLSLHTINSVGAGQVRRTYHPLITTAAVPAQLEQEGTL